MIFRVFTLNGFADCLTAFPDRVQEPFDPWEFLTDDQNILLTDGNRDFSLFVKAEREGYFEGHVLFSNAKGRDALALAKKMILHMIASEKLIHVFTVIPEENRKSRWFVRQLGFKQVSDDEFTLEIKDLKP